MTCTHLLTQAANTAPPRATLHHQTHLEVVHWHDSVELLRVQLPEHSLHQLQPRSAHIRRSTAEGQLARIMHAPLTQEGVQVMGVQDAGPAEPANTWMQVEAVSGGGGSSSSMEWH